jgi:endonuclease/exonuclease/phosphatase (EEP) superfamily protein YafD
MHARTPSASQQASPSVSRPARRLLPLSAAAATAIAGCLVAVPAHAEEQAPSDVTMVQANIKTAMPLERFQSDVREVLSENPTLVTYNEVPYRKGEVLAPEGYSIHRSVRNRYTAATPVVWRHPEWTKVDAGTFQISDVHRIPDGKHTKLGLRFANWATLRAADGRQLSVVSVHFAPLFKIDGKLVDLVRPSARRLGQLVEQLAPAGPVLVGGDFNVHYKSNRYPRRIFQRAGLVPTYDTLGSYFPTGDHQGATIDYVFNRGKDALAADRHRSRELYSDHDAVIAGLSWQGDAPADTQVVTNDPAGDDEARRAVVRELNRHIRAAAPGEIVQAATTRLAHRGIFRQLRAAVRSGTHVRMTARGERLTGFEARLRRVITRSGDRASWFRQCVDRCAEQWRDAGVPPGLMMIGTPGAGWQKRLDTNRDFSAALVERSSRVRIQTGDEGLAEGEALLRSVR